jgi:hypothetical protein
MNLLLKLLIPCNEECSGLEGGRAVEWVGATLALCAAVVGVQQGGSFCNQIPRARLLLVKSFKKCALISIRLFISQPTNQPASQVWFSHFHSC